MDIFILTETWLIKDIRSSEYFDENYMVFRKDREETNSDLIMGGGVLIAIKNRFAHEEIKIENNQFGMHLC